MSRVHEPNDPVQVLAHFPLQGTCGAPKCAGTVVAVSVTEREAGNQGGVSALMVCDAHIAKLQDDGFDVWAFQPTCGAPDKPGGPPCGARSEHLVVFRETEGRSEEGLGVAFVCDQHEVQFREKGRAS